MYIGAKMLKSKLLRLDEAAIREIEEMAQKMSEKEYTSFSALVRKLIRIGMDNMEVSFIEKVRQSAVKPDDEKEKVLSQIKKEIESQADFGHRNLWYSSWTFKMSIIKALNVDLKDVDKYFEMLKHITQSLRNEGFQVSCKMDDGFAFIIEW